MSKRRIRTTPRPPTGDASLDEALALADELARLGLEPRDYCLGSPYGGHLPGPSCPPPPKRRNLRAS
jgi:hypothetical protein